MNCFIWQSPTVNPGLANSFLETRCLYQDPSPLIDYAVMEVKDFISQVECHLTFDFIRTSESDGLLESWAPNTTAMVKFLLKDILTGQEFWFNAITSNNYVPSQQSNAVWASQYFDNKSNYPGNTNQKMIVNQLEQSITNSGLMTFFMVVNNVPPSNYRLGCQCMVNPGYFPGGNDTMWYPSVRFVTRPMNSPKLISGLNSFRMGQINSLGVNFYPVTPLNILTQAGTPTIELLSSDEHVITPASSPVVNSNGGSWFDLWGRPVDRINIHT